MPLCFFIKMIDISITLPTTEQRLIVSLNFVIYVKFMSIPREQVFKQSEFETRRQAVRKAMAESGIDTLIVHSAPNIYYLCGHHTLNLWDYQCLALPLEKKPFMVLWQFERGRFEASAVDTQLELFNTHDDPIEETVKALRKHRQLGGTVGIEAQTRYLVPNTHDALIAALEGTTVVNGSGLVDQVRNIKSDAELRLMHQAARITDQAVLKGFEKIAPGVSDSEVAAEVAAELIRHNSLGVFRIPYRFCGLPSRNATQQQQWIPDF